MFGWFQTRQNLLLTTEALDNFFGVLRSRPDDFQRNWFGIVCPVGSVHLCHAAGANQAIKVVPGDDSRRRCIGCRRRWFGEELFGAGVCSQKPLHVEAKSVFPATNLF